MVKIEVGQIRHTTRTPEVLIKVNGPYNSEVYQNGEKVADVGLFVPTNDFPKYHYIVVIDVVETYLDNSEKYCVCHLITHSNLFDNVKITNDLIDGSKLSISLANSYVTRDKFLVNIKEIDMSKPYGEFFLDKLKDALEY